MAIDPEDTRSELTGALLSVSDLYVSYGPARALFGVSLSVGKGEAVALLGPNGAGKSTTARAICGLVQPLSGQVRFSDVELQRLRAHQIRQLGLVYLPEGRGIFSTMSVLDNLRMAVRWIRPKSARLEALEQAYQMFPILHRRKNQVASSLSGGEQQMLSVASGLAMKPKLLIADELSLGLAPKAVDTVIEALNQARQAGVSVLLIEQYVTRALAFADRALILQKGTVRWSGSTDAASEAVIEHYWATPAQE
jgi:branched-chain amino acid transport system ATP-binding protein